MPAERRDFHAPVEELVYWDTSFALAYLYPERKYHTECAAFRNRLVSEGGIGLISDFVLDELAFVVVKGALVVEAQNSGRRWIDIKHDRPDLVKAAYASLAPKRAALDDRTLKIPLLDTVTDRVFQLMQDYALLPTNAYHIATSLESGVQAIVTLDEDFLAVDELIVYTCLPEQAMQG